MSVLSVVLITLFLFREGLPLFFQSATDNPPPSLVDFLFGREYRPNYDPSANPHPKFGILPFIVGSLYVTFGALVVAVPVGLSVGVFLAEIARGKPAQFLRSVVEILAAIPSIVYGFFGRMMIRGAQQAFPGALLDQNVFTASIILAIMTLPTIINVTEVSLRTVPHEFKEGSVALGGSRWQTIWRVLVPAGRTGIVTGVILGMGRAIGETMAVYMVLANQDQMPTGFLRSGTRTLTSAIVIDMGYSADDHRVSLFTIGIVLFVFILLLQLVTQLLTAKSKIKVQ